MWGLLRLKKKNLSWNVKTFIKRSFKIKSGQIYQMGCIHVSLKADHLPHPFLKKAAFGLGTVGNFKGFTRIMQRQPIVFSIRLQGLLQLFDS